MAISSRLCYGFLLLLLITTTWNINAVMSCQFGQGCLHQCNCAVSCDTLTGCSGRCAEGWDGPTCQRQNVALKQATKQSSTYFGPYKSLHAVDGKLGHELVSTPCTHTLPGTATQPATWNVTLDRVYRINRFQIYNRDGICSGGPCGSRLAGFTLSVENSSQSYMTCYIDTTADGQNPGNIINGSCAQTGPLLGNVVQIKVKTGNALTLCEVLIYVCSDGTYGNDCAQTCGLCAQGRSFCNKVSGNCPDRPGQPRCGTGYSGDKCNKECIKGTYGEDCQYDCGFCAEGPELCNVTSGDCPEKPGLTTCMAGYTGQKCQTAKKVDSTTCMGNQPDNNAVIVGCAVSSIVGIFVGIIVGIVGYRLFLYRRQRISENERRQDRTQTNDFVQHGPIGRENNRTNQTYDNEAVDQSENPYENASENIYDKRRSSQEGPDTNYSTLA